MDSVQYLFPTVFKETVLKVLGPAALLENL